MTSPRVRSCRPLRNPPPPVAFRARLKARGPRGRVRDVARTEAGGAERRASFSAARGLPGVFERWFPPLPDFAHANLRPRVRARGRRGRVPWRGSAEAPAPVFGWKSRICIGDPRSLNFPLQLRYVFYVPNVLSPAGQRGGAAAPVRRREHQVQRFDRDTPDLRPGPSLCFDRSDGILLCLSCSWAPALFVCGVLSSSYTSRWRCEEIAGRDLRVLVRKSTV